MPVGSQENSGNSFQVEKQNAVFLDLKSTRSCRRSLKQRINNLRLILNKENSFRS